MKLVKNKQGQRGKYTAFFRDVKGKRRQRAIRAESLKEAWEIARRAGLSEMEKLGAADALSLEAFQRINLGKPINIRAASREWLEWLNGAGRSPRTVFNYRTQLEGFLRDVAGNVPVNSVRREDVNKFINPDNKTSVNTRKVRLSVLNGFFSFCVKEGYCARNPARNAAVSRRGLPHRAKEPKRQTPVEEHEYHAIMASLEGFERAAVALAYWAGLRLTDICRLEWDSIGEDALTVWTTKSGTRVALPLDSPATGSGVLRFVLQGAERNNGRYVFPAAAAADADPSGRACMSNRFRRAFRRAGVEKSFHCLRHSFVTRNTRAGMDVRDIAGLAGHKNAGTTELYNHSADFKNRLQCGGHVV